MFSKQSQRSVLIFVALFHYIASTQASSLLNNSIPHVEQANKLKIVEAKDIKWGYLNPLRGDKSPRAANLWGDRTKNVSTGMLVKFKDGFSSPPHIHNGTLSS